MAKALEGGDPVTPSWSGSSVDVARIESELARLRYSAAGKPEGGEVFALRTSLLNLVVQAPDSEAAREAGEAIVDLASHHPSRALIVVPQPGPGESRIDARLAAHCHLAPGLEQQVCCEEITLRVNGPAASHLHSIVIPLLVPDLPVYVWWMGPLPAEAHMLEEMVSAADRFIVDSERFVDQAAGLQRLARLCDELPGCAVGDLNWERLQPWRQLLMQQCPAGNLPAQLEQVRNLKISFAGAREEMLSSQVSLLLGWLAVQLDWDTEAVTARDDHTLFFPGPRQEVSVEVRSRRASGVPAGTLLSLSLRCSGGGLSSISLSRIGDPLHIVLHLRDSSGMFEDHVRVEAGSKGEMLVRQLDAPAGDREYLEALTGCLPLIRALVP